MPQQHESHGKWMSLEEAVQRFVPDHAQVCLGGFTVNRNPMAVCREIIRQKKQNLHLVVHSHGQGLELLIGAGCVQRLELAYGGVARFAPTGIRFKKAFLEGKIEVEDYTNFQMVLRFQAGAMGLPFIATTSGLETDIVNKSGFSPEARGRGKVPREKLTIIPNPLDSAHGQVVILPPLNPDVTLIHAQYAGDDGTIRIKGLPFADLEQAKAAAHVIVTCEEVVPAARLRADPDQNSLAHFFADAVIQIPFGAHPTACHYFYDYDPKHLKLCREMFAEDDLFARYLEEFVYAVPSQEAYLETIGKQALQRIQADPELGFAPGLDRS
ncbi:MAG: hypothetical protein K9J81_02845 [Desulfohalobiaceae bacterium]|nr:hypothetical protein [Desulfohalobiaceae bacterium]